MTPSLAEDPALPDPLITTKLDASSKPELSMSVYAFKWIRVVAISLSLVWASIFGYLEADALNYTNLATSIFGHFTVENVMLLFIATILALMPFAVTIRFGDSRLSRKSIACVFQIICISILAEDISYFAILRQVILPTDWTAEFLGGFFVPMTTLFIPTWYVVTATLIVFSQYVISRI
ncbi:MAG: hypothetical protein PXY39_10220 [archaeon]|nr:hypothetical protein [archaeon]